MKKYNLIYGLYFLLSIPGFSQTNGYHGGFWNLHSLDGEVRFKSLYRQRYTTLGDFKEFQESLNFSGGLKLNTINYIWHPNFLQLELGGEYFPESNQEEYLVTPDRTEVRTLKGLNIGATLFNSKPITLKSWADWNDSYRNRENLTNIRSRNYRWGSSLNFRNRILPVNLGYSSNEWNEKEIQTGRVYRTEQENFEASTLKSFSWRDRSELNYSHNNYFRHDANMFEVENITDNFRFNNGIYFDREKKNNLRSMIYNYNRQGNQVFHIFNVTENLDLRLPKDFRFRSTYNLYKQEQKAYRSNQNKIMAGISHKLFLSLNTRLYYEYSGINHTMYRETRNTGGMNIRYTKQIPTGRLTIYYNYSLLHNNMDADPIELQVINEEQVLTDGEITLLEKPFIDINSILVKDFSGAIIYEEDFDYLLIKSGDYIEIQRIPGGQIPNGTSVYIDYTATQTGSYKYNTHSNYLNASINLFNRLIEIYYRGQFINYRNVEKSDLLVLNFLNGNTVGGKINYWNSELGIEYEDHNSTITPYKQIRYFFNIQKRFGKFILGANANLREYDIVEEEVTRRYADISGKSSYIIKSNMKVDLMVGYRQQRGPGIDLDLLTANMEYIMNYRQLFFTLGFDIYRRDYLGELNNYYGGFVKLSRRF